MKLPVKLAGLVLSGAMAASVLVSVPASAAPVVNSAQVANAVSFAPADQAAESDPTTNPNVTQLVLDLLAEERPAEYEAAQTAVQPYVADGKPLSAVPQDIIATLDPEIWAAFLVHEQASASAADRGTVLTEEELAAQEQVAGSIVYLVASFISAYWPQIKAAAIRSGKWAWYKAHRCIAGATSALRRASGGRPAYLKRNDALAEAIRGCINSL